MMESEFKKKSIAELNYSTTDAQALTKEFLILLHEVTSNYEVEYHRMQNVYRKEIQELRSLVEMYERKGRAARFYYWLYVCRRNIKASATKITKFALRQIKNQIINLGMKERVKKTYIYKKLYQSGWISRLKG